jgi:predicted RNA-binding Zn-ribbon protein involved in translation (DUF1610 family)
MTKRIEGNSIENNKPNILFLDIETAPMLVTSHTLWPNSLPHGGIFQDWYIICACWKWQGNARVYSDAADEPNNDKNVLISMSAAIRQADILVGHNIKRFDIKKLNARLIFHGLEPIPQVPMVDTLTEVKKIAQFTSNRLDYLGKHLLGEGKIHTSQELWYNAMRNIKSAIKEMVTYCKQDVVLLEKVYNKLLPYFKSHPHIGVLTAGVKTDCPKCGSIEVVKSKVRVTATGGKTQQYQCKSCGGYHTTPFKTTTK